jgi:anti-anti-sigma regulatory factor
VCVLTLTGVLHAGTLAVLEAEVDRLGRSPCHRVVLDVAALVDVDEAGTKVLTGLHHYVRARGGRLTVTGAGPLLTAVLAATPLLAS